SRGRRSGTRPPPAPLPHRGSGPGTCRGRTRAPSRRSSSGRGGRACRRAGPAGGCRVATARRSGGIPPGGGGGASAFGGGGGAAGGGGVGGRVGGWRGGRGCACRCPACWP